MNEIADTRAGLLDRLFRDVSVTRHNAEQIHDRLDPAIRPSVVLMNPPFSASPHVEGRFAEAAMRHIGSAFARLAEGGRLVAITGHNVGPDQPAWRDSFVRLQEKGRVVFTATISGQAYVRHGTSIETRLTVIDRVPADNPRTFPPSPGMAADTAQLLEWVSRLVPPRLSVTASAPLSPPPPDQVRGRLCFPGPRLPQRQKPPHLNSRSSNARRQCRMSPRFPTRRASGRRIHPSRLTACLYEGYALQTVHIPGATPHPTKLVQSAAMAAVAPPRPCYRPHLPPRLTTAGILSDAQLESVIYAGEAHAGHLAGSYTVDETYDLVSAAPADATNAVRFRRGWFLGDGTGAGKGRQVAAIILDNWLKGRKRAVWISKSDKLIEDAERDWTAIGGYRSDIVPLSRFRQGASIALDEGILFTTYATLRTQAKGDKPSRIQQIIDWLGREFDGVVVFDEAHAMANAAGDKGERGEKKPSQQGQAGLRLQHALHDARILYVSATGATTVQNLAYAARLGLWGTGDFPFATRADFVASMEKGGVAAMEVLARDLKALGLYAARSLSFEGIEYEIVEHKLTAEQIRIYDAYADAFQIIHKNLNEALKAANISGADGSTYNRNAKAAARSAFESNKQRFFNHLLTAMKCPTLIAALARDLEDGHACVLQVVSTNEALLDRRLAEIPVSEWGDLSIDITPREYVLDYLSHSFPTQLFELYTDDEGNLQSRPAYDADGNPVISREAVERRDRMIEHLASLPPVQGALDQILHRFGTDLVAEVTGRSRRIVKRNDRLVRRDPPGFGEFCRNRRLHGRRQAHPDFLRRRRHRAQLSRRSRLQKPAPADPLPARTRLAGGCRNPGIRPLQPHQPETAAGVPAGRDRRQGREALSVDDRAASRHLGRDHPRPAPDRRPGPVPRRRQSRKPVRQGVLAPVLSAALRRQDRRLFADGFRRPHRARSHRPGRLVARRTAADHAVPQPRAGAAHRSAEHAVRRFRAIARSPHRSGGRRGTYDIGVETLIAESFHIAERRTVCTYAATGAETRCYRVLRKDRNCPLPLAEALAIRAQGGRLLINEQTRRAAVQMHAASLMDDDGNVEIRTRLIRPMSRETLSVERFEHSHWRKATREEFSSLWDAECAAVPEFSESSFHIITGLLLPIWDRLPSADMRVYRFETDDGERVIGRLIAPEAMAPLYQALRCRQRTRAFIS